VLDGDASHSFMLLCSLCHRCICSVLCCRIHCEPSSSTTQTRRRYRRL